jgi:hypothetical protein
VKPTEALQFIASLPKLPAMEAGAPAVEVDRGMIWWRNRHNPFHVLQLHYYADPEKDPKRDGAAWFQAKSLDMGGPQSSRWQKEYEIDWKAQAGSKVFPGFDPGQHITPLSVRPAWYHRWIVWDYGLRNPTCALIIVTDEEGRHEVEAEYYARDRSVRESCYAVHRLAFELYAPKTLLGKVHFRDDELLIEGREELEAWESEFFEGVIGDPSMGEQREKETKTVRERFAEGGWYIAPGIRAVSGLQQVDTWFREGRLTIQRRCVHTIREVTYLVWADHRDSTLNYREREVDKNNHTTDCLKMFANQFPVDADRPTPNLTVDVHREDAQVREMIEQMRWQEQGDIMHPQLGGGW